MDYEEMLSTDDEELSFSIINRLNNHEFSTKLIMKNKVNELNKNVNARIKSENVKIECIDLSNDDDESLDGEIESITNEDTEELGKFYK